MDATVFDTKTLYQLGYGLYVLTTREGGKDNGCIVNTVFQVASNPLLIAVGVNKQNYTCEIIQKTGVLNINILTESTPFDVFKHFGYQSGRDLYKFDERAQDRSENGLIVLSRNVNGFISLAVEHNIDLGSHILFMCRITSGKLLSEEESLTYLYYQKYIKPNTDSDKKNGFFCRICGYFHEGDSLPEGFICPLCKHDAEYFYKL